MINKVCNVSFRGLLKDQNKVANKNTYLVINKDVFQKNLQPVISFGGEVNLKPSIDKVLQKFNKPIIPEAHLNAWLNQFEEVDRPTALKLIENIDFHTYPDMFNEVKDLHKIITQKLEKDGFDSKNFDNVDFSRIYTCKSGDLVSYIYRKANKIHNVKFKNIEALQTEKPENLNNKALVLLDDYIGTGTQFLLEFFARNPKNRDLLNQYKKIYFVSITAHENAIEKFDSLAKGKFKEVADTIFTEMKDNLAMQENEQMVHDLSLIAKDKLELLYLNKEVPLLSPKNTKLSQQEKGQLEKFLNKYNVYKYPFGVGNLQGHTAFFYSAPNTLPDLLWNSKATKKCGWLPLLHRTEDISVYRLAQKVPVDSQVW